MWFKFFISIWFSCYLLRNAFFSVGQLFFLFLIFLAEAIFRLKYFQLMSLFNQSIDPIIMIQVFCQAYKQLFVIGNKAILNPSTVSLHKHKWILIHIWILSFTTVNIQNKNNHLTAALSWFSFSNKCSARK